MKQFKQSLSVLYDFWSSLVEKYTQASAFTSSSRVYAIRCR